ncbi:MAG TPA: YceI family protein [Chitinophagales bacterium]|nr:YceI family protein [Chitinophagales bacterium]HMX59149.1 YceI family protein [Chitinophagales bacterium]HMY23059.1 YceI family protein [Chitinophagales bacterium]HMZ33246.1 YceI family protein [Chitinophagales bacterium]HNA39241.1 YceI family protein [Chitinophagales bacterium]
MRNKLLMMLLATLFFVACNTTPKGDKATTTASQDVATASGVELSTDSSSVIAFTGNGVGKNHPGKFKVVNGKITLTDGKLSAGTFTIDVKSLSLDEQGEMIQTKLKGHLLHSDFFDAEKFPTAKFDITNVEEYVATPTDKTVVDGANARISGNLTLKAVSKNVTFPAKITIADNQLEALANFNIDRTQWNMNYGNDKSLKDKFISSEVNIKIAIKATK